MCNFGHLHVHSEYSPLDGVGKLQEILSTAKSLGQEFIALTDHGTMSGIWEAQKLGDKIGIKVIHGCEFYYEYDEPFGNKNHGHLLILAKNNEGLKNMFKMHQWATKENFKRKPLINWEVLKAHSEGLIVTSACLGSEFSQHILAGDVGKATEWARKYKEVFGEDFYIELQPNQIPEQHVVNTTGIRIANQLGIELVATNDVHYVFEDDCFPHEVLLAMQVKKKMSDPKRFKFSTDDFWLKSEDEMIETFTGLDSEIVKQALANTKKIADKCEARLEKGHYLPKFHTIPEGETERSLLAKEITKGIKRRNLNKVEGFVKDAQYELDVVDRNGYCGYFLIVQDYVTSAKTRGELVGDGRGSGPGSKIAYATGITEIPPHEYDLLFERFMADGREPDFDVDFSDQQAIFRDLQGKYGIPNVSRIIAFGTMTPKAVTRKVMNTFEHPMHLQNEISALIPDGCQTLDEAISASPELQEYKKKYPVEFGVMERLQNVISHASQHAGGVLIYPGLGEVLPLAWDKDNEIFVAGFDKYMLEELGHFKFDVLGLETLPVLHGTIESIRRSVDPNFNIDEVNLEDKRVYDMLCLGDVSGVFQLSNQAQKVMEQQPRNFRDLIAINALVRPGVGDWEEYIARRNGKSYSIYEPRKSYMEETVGTMTYQEQFLLDCYHLAGWGIAYADKHVRKNKNIREDTELRQKFISDATGKGHEQETIEMVWAEIEDAVDGGYSFNKSHSASYAKLSYQTAYLKCHYPEHFYAAIMSGAKTDGDGQDEISAYIAECKKRGIRVLPPDINVSDSNFVVKDKTIAYRITTIKHVGDSAIRHIRELRPIESFSDLLERRDKSVLKKNVIVNLIKAGAFDSLNPDRGELMWEFEMSQRTKTQIKEGYECPRYELDSKLKMEWEKEVLGMYLSEHPMEKYGFEPIERFSEGEKILQGGQIVDVYEFHPQKNIEKPKMAFVKVDTLFGQIKVVVFASTWARVDVRETCVPGNIVLLRGKKSGNDLLLDSLEVLE